MHDVDVLQVGDVTPAANVAGHGRSRESINSGQGRAGRRVVGNEIGTRRVAAEGGVNLAERVNRLIAVAAGSDNDVAQKVLFDVRIGFDPDRIVQQRE